MTKKKMGTGPPHPRIKHFFHHFPSFFIKNVNTARAAASLPYSVRGDAPIAHTAAHVYAL